MSTRPVSSSSYRRMFGGQGTASRPSSSRTALAGEPAHQRQSPRRGEARQPGQGHHTPPGVTAGGDASERGSREHPAIFQTGC
uniref:Vimentin n=1 Tax=Callithrix jacchus TaxID=9483 RepID=A0A2R8MUL3_CALJA